MQAIDNIKTTSTTRIYLAGHGSTIRLVRASHRSQALSHVARSMINVKVASQDELVTALGQGIRVEAVSESASQDIFEATV